MSKSFFNLYIPVSSEEESEMYIGLLNEFSNFESVLEEENQLTVSYRIADQDQKELEQAIEEMGLIASYTIEEVEDENWNEVFEKSFQPLEILNGKWGIRASFHPPLDCENEIIIDPKMSFGTGHHETTKSVMTLLSQENFEGKDVFDYGSGTGILAIMAKKMGAKNVWANDNEEWAYKNSIENATINNVASIQFFEGDLDEAKKAGFLDFEHQKMDIIIANITKNILLASLEALAKLSKSGSILYLSGFYEADMQDLENAYGTIGYQKADSIVENNWTAMKLIKN
jgi:ribosomal protein L11 methyltransferase